MTPDGHIATPLDMAANREPFLNDKNNNISHACFLIFVSGPVSSKQCHITPRWKPLFAPSHIVGYD